MYSHLSPVHSIDADAQLNVNIKDTTLMQAASFDVDADADTGIGFISIPAPASASTSTLASESYCEPGFTDVYLLIFVTNVYVSCTKILTFIICFSKVLVYCIHIYSTKQSSMLIACQ